MRRITGALIILASIAAVAIAQAPASRTEDETAIRAIIQQVQDGWNAGDGKAFAAPFAGDADYVVINGMQLKGRDVIAAGHQRIFDTIYKNSQIRANIKSIKFLRPDVAIAHIEWNLKFTENGTSREGRAMNSQILTKENGRWSIIAFQNTSIEAAQR